MKYVDLKKKLTRNNDDSCLLSLSHSILSITEMKCIGSNLSVLGSESKSCVITTEECMVFVARETVNNEWTRLKYPS